MPEPKERKTLRPYVAPALLALGILSLDAQSSFAVVTSLTASA